MSSSDSSIIRRQVGGLSMLLAPRSGSGLIAGQILLRRGSADERQEEIGMASFTASMLKRGTTTRSSSRIALELESLGAMTSQGAGLDSSAFTIQSAAPDFAAALEVFFDTLRNPVFDPREFENERQSVIASLRRVEDEKFDFAYRKYVKQIFAGHGYGHSPEGEIADVEALTPEKCRAWHTERFLPQNMIFSVAGDFDPEAFCAVIAPFVEGWDRKNATTPRYQTKVETSPCAPGLTLRKELEQGFIVMGFRSPETIHPDHAALRLACAALGEGFAGRLFRHLRDERSLAYAVGAMLRTHRLGGHTVLYIGTQPERLEEARQGLLDEAENLRREGLTTEDLERARQYVAGKFLMNRQSLGARAGFHAQWEDLGVGAEYDWKYLDDLNKVTADQAREAAVRWWHDPTTIILQPEEEGNHGE